MSRALGIYVKHPVPGTVKTRLATKLGRETATDLYRAFVQDLIERFRIAADRRFLCFAPNTPAAETWFQKQAGSDYELWSQPAGNLEPRLQQFFEFTHRENLSQTVVMGSDSPTLSADYVEQAFQHLNQNDCVLGPATDGGYYLLGLRKPLPIFTGIEWSTPKVLRQTVDQISRTNASLKLLPPWYDVDTADDLQFCQGHLQALMLSHDPIVQTLKHTQAVLDGLPTR